MDAFLVTDQLVTQELLRLSLGASELGAWRFDLRTSKIDWSSVMKAMFGLPAGATVDCESFVGLVHPDDRDWVRRTLSAALDPAGPGECRIEHRVITPSGELKWFVEDARALFTDDGGVRTPILFCGTVRDITGSKGVETALQEASDRQQMLLHEVNHRVKNSLQLVSSLLRLQSRRIADPEAKRQLDDATNRIQAIAHIHQRLHQDQDIQRIDFGALLSELCSDLQGSSPQCSLKVETPSFALTTDRAIPLALIVNELVTNAFKYAYPTGAGPVSVRVDYTGGTIAIRVADQGVGLPEGFSADNANSLGMTLVASLLGQLSGRIEASNGSPGAIFTVTAPIHETHAPG